MATPPRHSHAPHAGDRQHENKDAKQPSVVRPRVWASTNAPPATSTRTTSPWEATAKGGGMVTVTGSGVHTGPGGH
jgi:hypothetical protein